MSLGLPILVYHSIDDSGSPISVSPRRFQAQMADLARRGYETLSLDELAALATGRSVWRQHAVVLTFDDALETVRSQALPILQSYGFRASVAVVTSRVGLDNGWPGQPRGIPRIRVLNWSELQELRAAGWEFISHTHTHASLDQLPADRVIEELQTSLVVLEQHLDGKPRVLAYPYGTVPRGTLAEVARLFTIALAGDNRQMQPGHCPHMLPRIEARYYLPGIPFCRPGGAWFGAYLDIRQRLRALSSSVRANR